MEAVSIAIGAIGLVACVGLLIRSYIRKARRSSE